MKVEEVPMSKLIEHITNPTRAKIFFEIFAKGQATAKHLTEKFPDISQPTIYRHIKALLSANMIKIVGEKPIRGVVEKSYSVNDEAGADISQTIDNNDGKGYLNLFIQFISGVTAEFAAYSEEEVIDIIEDVSAFTTAPFYATKDEIYEALTKIGEIVQPLLANEAAGGRRLRNFCTIITPPK